MVDEQIPTGQRANSQRWRWYLSVAGILLATGLMYLGLAEAQGENRAGLVVQFGDGRVETACVNLAQADFNSDGTSTGEELLRASGFPVVSEITGLGPAVCKVGNDGCNYPQTGCFCECTLAPGTSCRYWSYSRLVANQWVFSGMGSGSTAVRPGDVEGWVWGVGTVNAGAQPAVRTFAEICAAQVATATPTPSLTSTPSRTATHSATPETPTTTATSHYMYVPHMLHLVPTWTPGPSSTPSATVTRSATVNPTRTPANQATIPEPSATPQEAVPSPQPTDVPDQDAAPTNAPAPTDIPTLREPEEQEQRPTTTPTTEVIGQTGATPAPLPYPAAASEELPLAETAFATATPPSATSEPFNPPASPVQTALPLETGATTIGAPTSEAGSASSQSPRNYIVFLLLVGLLSAGWIAVRRLRVQP